MSNTNWELYWQVEASLENGDLNDLMSHSDSIRRLHAPPSVRTPTDADNNTQQHVLTDNESVDGIEDTSDARTHWLHTLAPRIRTRRRRAKSTLKAKDDVQDMHSAKTSGLPIPPDKTTNTNLDAMKSTISESDKQTDLGDSSITNQQVNTPSHKYQNILEDLPADWPHPVLGSRTFERFFADNRFFTFITDPRIARALRFGLVCIPAYYTSVYPTALGEDAVLVGIAFMVFTFMAPHGLGSITAIAFILLAVILSYAVTSLLLACTLAGSNALLLVVYFLLCLFFGLGGLGPLGKAGRLLPLLIFIITASLFWSLYPTAVDGLNAIIPMPTVEAVLQEKQQAALAAAQSGEIIPVDPLLLGFVSQLTQMMTANETTSVFVPIPESLDTPLTGLELNITVVPGDSVYLNIPAGSWVISDILWGDTNSGLTTIRLVVEQVCVALAFFIACFLLPPYKGMHRETRHIMGRVLATCTSAYSDIARSLTKPSGETADSYMISLAQATFGALATSKALIMAGSALEPNWITPSPLSRIDKPLGTVHERIVAMATELFMQSVYETQDDGTGDEEVLDALLDVKLACGTLVEKCGYAICQVPYPGMKSQSDSLADELSTLESDLNNTYRRYKRLYLSALHTQLQSVEAQQEDRRTSPAGSPGTATESQESDFTTKDTNTDNSGSTVERLLVDSVASECQVRTCFRDNPIRLSEAMRDLLHAQYDYSVLNMALSVFLWLFVGAVGALANIFLHLYLGLKAIPHVRWRGEGAWYQDRKLHTLMRYSVGLFILFIIPLYSVTYRTWVWPDKQDMATPTQYLVVPTANRMEMWSVLSFLICLFPTIEATTHKALARMFGIFVGCLMSWLILWSSQGEGWAVIAWLTVTHMVTIFFAAEAGSVSVVWVNPAWGYASVATQICITIVCLEYWHQRESYTIEYYILSRFVGNYFGAILAILMSMWILPQSAGFNARVACLRTYEHLVNGLRAAVDSVGVTVERKASELLATRDLQVPSQTKSPIVGVDNDTKGSAESEDNGGKGGHVEIVPRSSKDTNLDSVTDIGAGGSEIGGATVTDTDTVGDTADQGQRREVLKNTESGAGGVEIGMEGLKTPSATTDSPEGILGEGRSGANTHQESSPTITVGAAPKAHPTNETETPTSVTREEGFAQAVAELTKASATLASAQELLADASVMPRGPIVVTDGRLNHLRVYFAILYRIAEVMENAADIAGEERTKSTLRRKHKPGRKHGDSGTSTDQAENRAENGSESESDTDEESHHNLSKKDGGLAVKAKKRSKTSGMAKERNRDVRDARGKDNTPGQIPHEVGVLRIDNERKENAYKALEELSLRLRGVLWAHSNYDAADLPLWSKVTLSDSVKRGDDEALIALIEASKKSIPSYENDTEKNTNPEDGVKVKDTHLGGQKAKHGQYSTHRLSSVVYSGTSEHLRSRRDLINSILCLRVDIDHRAALNMTLKQLIHSVHSGEASDLVYFALSLARFQDYSGLVLQAYSRLLPESDMPYLQELFTVRNARSRRFTKALEAKEKDPSC